MKFWLGHVIERQLSFTIRQLLFEMNCDDLYVKLYVPRKRIKRDVNSKVGHKNRYLAECYSTMKYYRARWNEVIDNWAYDNMEFLTADDSHNNITLHTWHAVYVYISIEGY